MSLMATHLIGFGARRAATTWTPASLPSLAAWYRADLGVTESGGNVTAWADQSGNGRDLSGGSPDLEATGGPNSTPTISFVAGNSDKLTCTFSSMSHPLHLFAVMRAITTSGVAGLLTGGAIGQRFHDTQSPSPLVYFGGSTLQPGVGWTDDSNHHLWEYRVNGTSSSVIRGATTMIGTGTSPGTSGLTGITVGQLLTQGYGSLKLAELILCNVDISGGDLTSLRSYVNTRYGLTTS